MRNYFLNDFSGGKKQQSGHLFPLCCQLYRRDNQRPQRP